MYSKSQKKKNKFKNPPKIVKWLSEMGIKNYLINLDFSVDIHGNLDLKNKKISFFPNFIQFKNVSGYFDCSFTGLISLKGAPKYVGSSFICSNNNLKILKGGPEIVRGNVDCKNNPLEFLDGFPKEIGGYLVLNKGLFPSIRIESICKIDEGVYEYNPDFPK